MFVGIWVRGQLAGASCSIQDVGMGELSIVVKQAWWPMPLPTDSS